MNNITFKKGRKKIVKRELAFLSKNDSWLAECYEMAIAWAQNMEFCMIHGMKLEDVALRSLRHKP